MDKTLVDSIYINNSGGKVLLDYFVNTVIKKGFSRRFYFLLDPRGEYTYLNAIDHRLGENSEKFRKNFYVENSNGFTKVFCFGNVPPPIKLNIEVITYFHNALLAKSIKGYPLKVKILKYLKRLYIKRRILNTDMFFVQSKSMKEMMHKSLSSEVIIDVYPFYNLPLNAKYTARSNKEFVYISNGNSHKNHVLLLDVWKTLHEKNIRPKLHLTITKEYPAILKKIEVLKNEGVNIENHGYTDVEELFKISSFLIYPSLIESFGLGLVEAVNAGLKIIASDLDYVREVVQPSLTFNPYDKYSILEAVKKVTNDEPIIESRILIKNRIDELINILIEQ